MSPIAANLQAMRRRISEELQGDSRFVTIVAVSKAQPAEAVREAFAAGQRDFGENYVQEALAKMDALADLAATWHFIGSLQSNKARDVAERFDWVHSIDRAKIADALSRHRPAGREPLNVCVQVNISHEPTKGGLTPEEVPALARHVAGLPRLRLRGLMGVASPSDASAARGEFALLAAAFRKLRAEGLDVDTLSMGMTQDFPAALAEGATMLRIGTAIFGPRAKKEGAAA
jgi:pyridoxal phosphate enzyme (YggS family)